MDFRKEMPESKNNNSFLYKVISSQSLSLAIL